MKFIYSFFIVLGCLSAKAQSRFPELKHHFKTDTSLYLKASFVGQFWTRYTDLNPGSSVNQFPVDQLWDVGIRRLRFNVMAQVSPHVFLYAQFGQNNFNYTSKLYTGSFFHDAVGELTLVPKHVTLGMGLTGWSGLSRFAAPAAGSILGIDAPLYQQVTNGINDQFLRKLSVYAKGKWQKLDYRFVVSKPFLGSNAAVAIGTLNANNATFSLKPSRIQTQGYVNYSFWEEEDNTLGYFAGTHLGKKKVLTLGAGWIQQRSALWRLDALGDTLEENMNLVAVDLFMERPLSAKRNAVTVYAAWSDFQLGQNYLRMAGVMNPATEVLGAASLNGAGNNYPLIGTGQSVFLQLAYKFKDRLLRDWGTFQVYSNTHVAKWQALDQPMDWYDAGLNWYLSGTQQSKLTLGYQLRPVFSVEPTGRKILTDRKGMILVQYQIAI